MTLEDLAGRLDGVRWKAGRAGFTARCPAHDDRQASLSVDHRDDRILVKCFAGCSVSAVADAVGVSVRDLFVSPNGKTNAPRRGRKPKGRGEEDPPLAAAAGGCTLLAYAAAKGLPAEFLQRVGVTEAKWRGAPAVRIPYFSPDGTETAVRYRIALQKGEADHRFVWRQGSKTILYGLWRLSDAREAGYIVVVEGESDAQTLWYAGFPAVGLPGASNWREERDTPALEGIPTIYVIVEPDAGGEAVRRWLAGSSIRRRVKLVRLPGGAKDPSELYLSDPDAFPDRMREALANATPWEEEEEAARRAEAEAALAECHHLATAPDILSAFAEAVRQAGVAGEERAAKLLYLVLCSRFLRKPVSAVVKGPSSAGKSFLTETVLSFFPPEAAYPLTAMSERALAYSNEPLKHRFLVLYEAAGVSGEFGTYLIRSLLSEGRVRYETVEKTGKGLQPKLLAREGPTGLLVTTTLPSLHPENETRLLSIPVSDSPSQTRAVLLALAREEGENVDRAPWHALQRWLAGAEHRVAVPFAERLAAAIPPVHTRLRRDFGALLNLIRVHALLHQRRRERDAEGRVLSTLADYSAVRGLLGDLISDTVEATVSPAIRETVEAVSDLVADGAPTGVTVAAVAERLGIDKSAAWRRVQVAIRRGYIQNVETARGKPARLLPGDRLPEEQGLLPPPEALEEDETVARLHAVDQPVATGATAKNLGTMRLPEVRLHGCTQLGGMYKKHCVPVEKEKGENVFISPPDTDQPCNRTPGTRVTPTFSGLITTLQPVASDAPPATAPSPSPPGDCPWCASNSWWRLAGGPWRCGVCHPPAYPEKVEEWAGHADA